MASYPCSISTVVKFYNHALLRYEYIPVQYVSTGGSSQIQRDGTDEGRRETGQNILRRENGDYDWAEERSYWKGEWRINKIKNRDAGFSKQKSFSITKN